MVGYIILGTVYYLVSTTIFFILLTKETRYGLNSTGVKIAMIPIVRLTIYIIIKIGKWLSK
jgi:hypothetical protein